MCIVSLAWKAHPRWPLVAIGNRDELHARPAEQAHRWAPPGHMLAGRDRLAGGTWLGLSEQGRFAVVTNLYGFGTPQPDRASRGDLLKHFLAGEGRYADLSVADYADFNPFNLITVAEGEAAMHSNRPVGTSHGLAPGVHGLSNGRMSAPWPKSPHLDQGLRRWLAGDADDPAALLACLLDQTGFAPRGAAAAAAPAGREPQHSPIFIRDPVYGTRCSSVVAVDAQGRGLFLERRFDATGSATGETRLPFSWPAPV